MSAKHALPARARAHGRGSQPHRPERGVAPARPYRRGAAPARPGRGRRLLARAKTILAASALLAAASIVGVVGGTSTYALWSSSAPLPGTTVSAGDAALRIDGTLLPATNMLPGEVSSQALAITNSGSIRLQVDPTIDAVSTAFELRVLIIGTGTACPDLAQYPAVGTTVNAAIPTAVIDAGETLQLCTTITATASALPGDTATFRLALTGTQAG